MHVSRISKTPSTRFVIVALLMLGTAGLQAQTKKPAPPPKTPADTAKPTTPAAPATRPSGAGGAGTTAPAHGPAAGSITHIGPAANGPRTGPPIGSPERYPVNQRGGAGKPVTIGDAQSQPAHTTVPLPPGSHHPVPNGSALAELRNGSIVQTRAGGRVSDVHDVEHGIDIHHGLDGTRTVSVERPDHSRIVAESGRAGYVERGFQHEGHAFVRRTYYSSGRAYNRYYRGYYYHGSYLRVYAPGHYYAPGFYGWAYNPWAAPISYSWGWAGSPWYGYYGSYFTPYPAYPSASFWLTDYLLSSGLAADYQAQQAAQAQGAVQPDSEGFAPLTPETKQMIATEVQNQLALENAEAQQNTQSQEPNPESSGIARLLSDGKPHVFVAGTSLDLVDARGAECLISDSDVLELATPPPSDATSANLVVLSSKGGRECPKSDTVTVAVADLQDMQNHMRETIDQGLQELQAKQGTGGLPAAPASATVPPVDAAAVAAAPPPDPSGAALIDRQLAEADKDEKEVVGQAQQENAGLSAPARPAVPATIARGQSIDQVTATLGTPRTIVDLGSKKIYVYNDIRITFKNGKVADVQ